MKTEAGDRVYEINKCLFIGGWVAGLDGEQKTRRYAAISVVMWTLPRDGDVRLDDSDDLARNHIRFQPMQRSYHHATRKFIGYR